MREDIIKQLEMQCHREWQKRDIVVDYAMQPFSEEEVEHITMLNNHLIDLTRKAMDKAQRVDKDLRDLIAQGRKDYRSFHVDAAIVVDMLEHQDLYSDDFRHAIDASRPFSVIGLDEEHTEKERSEHIRQQLSLMNEQDNPIGRRWMELWTRYHIALCMAFAWFFDDEDFFTPDDIMKLEADNFSVRINVEV